MAIAASDGQARAGRAAGYAVRPIMVLQPRRARLRLLLQISDLAAMTLGLLWAAQGPGSEGGARSLAEFLALRMSALNCAVFLCLLGCWHGCFGALGVYRREPLLSAARLLDAALGAAAGVVLLALAGPLLGIGFVNGRFALRFWAVSLAALCALRVGIAGARSAVSGAALQQRRVLLVGSGPRARRMAEQLEQDSDAAVRIVGFADEEGPGLAELRLCGRPVCELQNLTAFLRGQVVDEVVVALATDTSLQRRAELLEICREHGVTVRFPVSALVEIEPEANESGGRDELLLSLYHGARGGWARIAKRAFDLLLGVPLLLLCLPVLAIAALGIALSSGGPIFFTQERVGFNKRRFPMYKFRTMVADAEARLADLEHLNEATGPTFKLRRDPRVTAFGRILRVTSIDELPQLFNVLRGEMSLVGPRPLPLRDFERFEQDWQRRRFSVLPGLTGLWQVSGRSSLPFERWIELDLRYIDQWSLGLDLWILLRTIPAVLLRVGAQ